MQEEKRSFILYMKQVDKMDVVHMNVSVLSVDLS